MLARTSTSLAIVRSNRSEYPQSASHTMTSLVDLVTYRVKSTPPAAAAQQRHSVAIDGSSSTKASLAATAKRTTPLTVISARHYDHLIGELRCPACQQPLRAPIRLCQSGHSLCADCTMAGRTIDGGGCPLCAEPLTATRSLALETLAARAAFGCANASGGCTVRLRPEALREHERGCVYQLGECFMGRVWGGCEWRGRELDWLRHCQAEHADRILEGAEQTLQWPCTSYEQKPKPLAAYFMVRAFGEYIYIRMLSFVGPFRI